MRTEMRLAACFWLSIGTAVCRADLEDPAALDRYLDNAIADTGIPGVVALVTDAEGTVYIHAAGSADVANGEPMRPDTIFRIASMTKPVAATAIMLLVEAGRLSLDDPISRYLPEYADARVLTGLDAGDGSFETRAASRPITIRHLLSHSSGLAYAFASDAVSTLNARGTSGTDVPLLYDPGEGWSYGNGISIVARVLEQTEDIGLDAFLEQRLFAPLGMDDTFYAVPGGKAGRVATTHARDPSGAFSETPNPAELPVGVSGDGGLYSTAADYARFIRLILNDGVAPTGERLLASDSVAELGRNQLDGVRVTLQDQPLPNLALAFPLGAGRDGFGLGFQVTGKHGDALVRAPGSLSWAGIYNTEFWIDPANGIGAVLLMQYLPFYDPAAIDVLEGFESIVYSSLR